MIPTNYDLKAPDFSYLIITELKDFYYNKHALLMNCKTIAAQIASAFEQYSSDLSKEIQILHEAVQLLRLDIGSNRGSPIFSFVDELHAIAANVATGSANICEVMALISEQSNDVMNLDAFRNIPSLLEVSSPLPD